MTKIYCLPLQRTKVHRYNHQEGCLAVKLGSLIL